MEALGYVGPTYEEEEQKPPAARPASQPGQPQP
jgi:hypothetical protein